MRRRLLFALIGLVLAACASAARVRAERFEGDWSGHFETSSFTTDDGRGPWWLSGDGAVWDALNAPLARAGRGPWGRLHIVVEAELSPPGAFGHLGVYERELRVTRVIEARLIDAPP